MATRRVLSTSITLILLYAPPTLAQPALDRVVGLTDYQQPLVIRKLDSHAIGSLAQTAGVPIGFEGLVPLDRPLSIRATTRRLRDVLDAVIAADPRYEWREDDGVIVMRPVEAWNDQASALNNTVDGVKLEDVVASDLFPVLARLLGVLPNHLRLGDTRRFSVETPANSTLLQTLNAMVRAHGSLSWAFLPLSTPDTGLPTSMTLLVGGTGAGFGIPASAMTCCGARSPIRDERDPPAGGESSVEPTSSLHVAWAQERCHRSIGLWGLALMAGRSSSMPSVSGTWRRPRVSRWESSGCRQMSDRVFYPLGPRG